MHPTTEALYTVYETVATESREEEKDGIHSAGFGVYIGGGGSGGAIIAAGGHGPILPQ